MSKHAVLGSLRQAGAEAGLRPVKGRAGQGGEG